MALIRIETHHLKKGMIIKSDVYNRSGVILVPENTVVTKEVFDLLTRHFIDDVIVDYATEGTPAPITIVSHHKKGINPKKLKEFVQTYQIAEKILTQNLIDVVEKDKEIDIPALLKLLQSVINKADGELSLCDMLQNMQRSSETLYSHSINVALYAQLLARWSGFNDEEIELVSLAGLLHDIGHMKYPDSETFTFTLHDGLEKRCHEQHPTLGYQVLQNKEIDHRIKQAVLTHHERFDESGFPLGISFVNINQITRVLSIADCYVTLITEEQGHPALTPFDALKSLQETDYKKYDNKFLTKFIERVSQNYIQHDVLLSNGQIGTIILLNKQDITRPLVQVDNIFMDLSIHKNVSIEKILN